METKINQKILWTCPKCGRKFERKNQMHSCKIYPLEAHFERKTKGKMFYEVLQEVVQQQIGSFKIESLECCIHFINPSTFLAVKILNEKIEIHFSLNKKIENKRINKCTQMSAHSYLYYVEIIKEGEIDKELVDWIHEAYHLKNS